MKKLLFAMAIGAALAWMFDPDAGSRRRALLRRKIDESGLTGATTPAPQAPSAIADYPTPLVATGR